MKKEGLRDAICTLPSEEKCTRRRLYFEWTIPGSTGGDACKPALQVSIEKMRQFFNLLKTYDAHEQNAQSYSEFRGEHGENLIALFWKKVEPLLISGS